jgi:transcriptional regulator of aromatic amino acid metabolism
MNREMFEPTIPFGEPELMRASGYQRYLDELQADSVNGAISTRISQLSPSLQADLLRFGHDGGASEVVYAMPSV